MEEYFVTYKQALALKELGYNEPCWCYFVNDVFFDSMFPKDYDYFEHMNKKMVYTLAPLKSQAFKWFRDKGFDFATLEKYKDKGKFYGGYINKPDERFGHSFGSNFKTYEEAESACIDKLIELIKNK